jgi:hypothetical protein
MHDHLRSGGRTIAHRVGVRTTYDGDVTGSQPHLFALIKVEDRLAAQYGGQAQRRAILDPDGPGGIQHDAKQVGTARARPFQ